MPFHQLELERQRALANAVDRGMQARRPGVGAGHVERRVEALRAPGLGERLKTLGAEPVGSGPAQMGTYLTSEIARWTNLAKTVKFEVSN